MKITPFFLLAAFTLIAPHLPENQAKLSTLFCIVFALLFWLVEAFSKD